MSELVLQRAMILVGGCFVFAGIVIAAEIIGYSVPFGGPILLICAALIIVGVYVVNRDSDTLSAGPE